jgi:sulfur transfer protein SufE
MFRLGAIAALIGALVPIHAHATSAETLAAEPVITASGCQTYNWLTASCRSDKPAQFVAAQAGDHPTAGACQAYNWLTARCRSGQPAQFAAKQDMETIIAKGCQANNWLTAPCHGAELVQVAAAQDIESLVVRGCNVNNWLTVACKNGPVSLAAASDGASASDCGGYNWLTASCRTERPASIAASHSGLTTASIGDDAMMKRGKRDRKEATKAPKRVAKHMRKLSHASARRHDPDVATLVRISMMTGSY